MTFAPATYAMPTGGVPYASAAVLPATEADLYNVGGASPLDPVPVLYDTSVIVASLILVVAGAPGSNTCYVVLQTSLDGVNWFDLAWAKSAATSGTLLYLLSAGVSGQNPLNQTRANGTAPSATSSSQSPLGALLRFTGQATLSGGTVPSVSATIKYRLIGAAGQA